MRKLFITFLLLIQTFFLCANAGEINFSSRNFDKHIEYIQTQTTPTKRIYVDFKNYENAVLSLGSKTEEIFSCKYNRNFDSVFIGFSNSGFNSDFKNEILLKQPILSEFHNIFPILKNEIHTRAP